MSAARAAVALAAAAVLTGSTLGLAGIPDPPDPPPPPTDRPYAWPVPGPVLRGFEGPVSPFGPGHRGIDIGAPPGTPVRAAASGIVAFAGRVAGERYVSIDHPDGIRTTYSWLAGAVVEAGTTVTRGQVIGRSGEGHPGAASPHLHFGARIGQMYLDPLLLLGVPDGMVHLAPLPSVDGGPHP